MDPDMVRQQFEEEAEVKQRAKSGDQPPAADPAIPVANALASAPPAESPALPPAVTAIAIPPQITPPPGIPEDPPATAALEHTAISEPPPELSTIAVEPEHVPEPLVVTLAQEQPPEPPVTIVPSEPPAVTAIAEPAPVRRAFGALTAAFAYTTGALAGQVLAAISPPVPAVEPFRILILTALYAYVCAFLAAAALTARPEGVRRARFYSIHSGGAFIAATAMEAALIASGLLNSGYGELVRTETWTAYAIAAGTALAVLWPLTRFRMKRAARVSVRTAE